MKPIPITGELIRVSMFVETDDGGRGNDVGMIGLYGMDQLALPSQAMPQLGPFTKVRPRLVINTAEGAYLLDPTRHPGPYPLNIDLPRHHEAIRQTALAKLTDDEIIALGLKR